MKKSTRTICGAVLDTARRYGDPVPVMPNSTLNQKFDVFPNEKLRPGEYPQTQYLAIGMNGVRINMENDGLYTTTYREYQPGWASLFLHVPFLIRPVDNDITPSERLAYRMRRVIPDLVNGTRLVGYYLRKIDTTLHPLKVEHRTFIGNNISSNPWSHPPEALTPVPLNVNPNQRLRTGDDYLAVNKPLEINFSPNDIQELMDVANILYGNPEKANITEFALVSGVDRNVQGVFNGVNGNYTEACYAQITDFVKSTISAPNALRGQKLFIDAGSNEPMLVIDQGG